MLLGEEVDLPKAETKREELLKALKALSTETHVADDVVCKALEYA